MEVITTGDVAAVSAEFLSGRLSRLLENGGRASLAVSGGSTPWSALEQLADADLAWKRIDILQVDERIAPPGNSARNLTKLRSALLSRVAAIGHPMPVNDDDLDLAAARYAGSLPASIDIVQLGLGSDGHTASLVPGDPVLDIRDRDVAITEPYQGLRRMTLTFTALGRAGKVLWIVSGSEKREILGRMLEGDPTIPATTVRRDNAVVIADPAALGTWAG